MSSTKRGSDRHVADYYATPISTITTFLEAFEKVEPGAISGAKLIVDPCAGGDTHNPASYPEALKSFGVDPLRIVSFDIRTDSKADFRGHDYLQTDMGSFGKQGSDIIITNPPFILAQEFIEKGLRDIREGGFVIMLLRLNYFGSRKRKPFWDRTMPKYAFVHNERISFTANGQTDSIEYMHCCWQKSDTYPESTELRII